MEVVKRLMSTDVNIVNGSKQCECNICWTGDAQRNWCLCKLWTDRRMYRRRERQTDDGRADRQTGRQTLESLKAPTPPLHHPLSLEQLNISFN